MPNADLHTPEELLAGAEALLRESDPQTTRAAVLEALTALEAFVHRTVFGILNEELDPLLAKWLDEKTRMDFDSRLGILTPVALGQLVDKRGDLWNRYKKAKEIRNAVTHSGRRVSHEEARIVVRTVHDWLAYLGSTVELDLALLGLKRYVEKRHVPIRDGGEATQLISDYFRETDAAKVSVETGSPPVFFRPDLVLTFGESTVTVEVKFVQSRDVERVETEAVRQVEPALEFVSRAAIALFNRAGIPKGFPSLRHHANGRVSVVFISAAPRFA